MSVMTDNWRLHRLSGHKDAPIRAAALPLEEIPDLTLDANQSYVREQQSPGYTCPFCPDREHKYPRPDNLQRYVALISYCLLELTEVRHVRIHHVDRDRDDPQLRDVLSQRLEGPPRGRRRRPQWPEIQGEEISQPSNPSAYSGNESATSAIVAHNPQQAHQLSTLLHSAGKIETRSVNDCLKQYSKSPEVEDCIMEYINPRIMPDRQASPSQAIEVDVEDDNMHLPKVQGPQESNNYNGILYYSTTNEHLSRDIQHESNQHESSGTASLPITSPQEHPGHQSTQLAPYKCFYCHKTFLRPHQKRRHELTHSKPAKCDEPNCHWAFSTKKDLRRHQNSTHRGGRTFCTYSGCDGIFTRYDNWLRHMKNKHS